MRTLTLTFDKPNANNNANPLTLAATLIQTKCNEKNVKQNLASSNCNQKIELDRNVKHV